MGEQAHIPDVLRVYAAVTNRFGVAAMPAQLHTGNAHPLAAEKWFATVEAELSAYQLRQYLQETAHDAEHDLAPLIKRYLKLPTRNEALRQKLEVLLAFYLIDSPTASASGHGLESEKVADILKPVLGDLTCRCGHPTEPVNVLINIVHSLKELRDIKRERILDRSRQLKESFGEAFFCPASLVAFAGMNFAVQRAFIRLRSADIRSVSDTITELQKHGVTTADCKQAGMSTEEPLTSLQQLCNQWQHGGLGDYAGDRSLEQIIGIRQALELALHRATRPPVPSPIAKPQPPAVPTVANIANLAKPAVVASAPVTTTTPTEAATARAAALQQAATRVPPPVPRPVPRSPITPKVVMNRKRKSGISRILGWQLWTGLIVDAIAIALTQPAVIARAQDWARYVTPASAMLFVISGVLIGLSLRRTVQPQR